MRTLLLLTTLALLLEGCAVALPKQVQPDADHLIDEQLAVSASSISLAQRRLQQTAPPPLPAEKPAGQVTGVVGRSMSDRPVTKSASSSITTQVKSDVLPIRKVTPALTSSPGLKPAVAVSTTVASKTLPAPTTPPAAVVAPSIPAKSPAPAPKPVWDAQVGETLRKAITRWCQRAHYTLDWQAESLDYPIEAPLRFSGSFEEAVKEIFHLYDKAPRTFIVDGRIAQSRLIVSENNTRAMP